MNPNRNFSTIAHAEEVAGVFFTMIQRQLRLALEAQARGRHELAKEIITGAVASCEDAASVFAHTNDPPDADDDSYRLFF